MPVELPRITHVMRAPVVGGSELETATIVRRLRKFRHDVVYPDVFRHLEPTIIDRFPEGTSVCAVPDLEGHLHASPADIIHIQFPFLIHPWAPHLDSVLIFKGFDGGPPAPVVFTVHAAVNVPVVPRVHYLFHTAELAAEFSTLIDPRRITIAPSLIDIPGAIPDRAARDGVEILWVSRNEDAKFHTDVPAIVDQVHERCPQAGFVFIGHPVGWPMPDRPWVRVEPCPSERLDQAFADADLFWFYPASHLNETWCRTVTEALARGLPCVVAAHGAMRVQVRDGIEGRVVGTPTACVRALVELVTGAEVRRSMGAAARARACALNARAESAIAGLYERLAFDRQSL